ncbi:Conserved_hypothetical protein [Hexamita inflata]|uniref:Uncharacterized protein n=1 Tax=Hexamita inflata TaxID=28002 RepID=A0ABP1GNT5_9EUKA
MNIFNNQLLNNRIQKIFDSEFNMLSEFEYSDNTFGKLFLDVCLFFKLQEDQRPAITNVQKALNMTSKWQFNKREQQLIKKYGTLSVESIKMDIEQQIHLIDQNILNSLLLQQTNQENEFEIISMVLYTLKVVDDLKCIDENTTLIVRKCSNLTFDEVPTKISNLVIDNTQDTSYIQSLEGLQKMKQLTFLQIQGQSFLTNKDQILNTLENLTNLSLNDNYVDESELDFSQLNKLIALDLSNNKLQNYSQLTLPDNLKMLNVSSNNISCLNSFHFIRLVELDLQNNKIQNLVQLSQMRYLTKLNLSNNSVSDISPLYNNDCLVELCVSHNNIQSLNSYNYAKHGKYILKNLLELIIVGNQIQNITDLKYMPQLEHLDVGSNKLQDLQPLEYLTGMKCLLLGENDIYNIWPLKRLINLEELDVNSNKIVDISVVQYLLSLKRLFFHKNQVQDISAIKCLNLEALNIYFNYIVNNHEFIQKLAQLKIFVVNNPKISSQHFQLYPKPEMRRQNLRIKFVFGTNNANQNVFDRKQQINGKFKQFKAKIDQFVQKTVMDQIRFTAHIAALLQSD